ncbi:MULTISPECIES: acyl-CoA dehydrogenase [unclassified Variovorax]|uniref:acyl-CoA dehydrogenase n=1 Tax=unclassified Variovorax TaxID=663243 RepID=UPI00257922C0|nr:MULTISPECIES: acyl-CoA dehydrogenase [unclassified Variovorax]MDM0086690.1 acyl-CoA dehydrogenase [Variovorax sp. J22G40]MDM0145054.1 acyl-CoA dehydrogenase [Variovorax sp. J2P1-31]
MTNTIDANPTREAGQAARRAQQALARARELARTLRSDAAVRDAQRILPYDALRLLREHQLLNLRTPLALGGDEIEYGDVVRVIAELARGDSNVAQLLIPHYVYLERLRLMGEAPLQARIWRRVREGALVGNASTERNTSRSGEITIRLEPEGAGFRFSGRKFYSTPTLFADVVFATVLDPQGRIVYAVLPTDREGITRLDDWDGLGQRLTGSGTTVFENVRVEADEIVLVGDWMNRRHYTSSGAQILFAAVKSGIAHAALDEAIDWAREGARPTRVSQVEHVTLDPHVQVLVGELSTAALGAELVLHRAADALTHASHVQYDETSRERLEQILSDTAISTAQAQLATEQAALHIAQKLFDVGGTSTALRRHNFDRHWRNARTISLHDPIVYRSKAIGAHALRGEAPPLGFTY